MSLKVWLPLDGDLHNQGTSNALNIISNNTSVVSNGKIGKCMKIISTTDTQFTPNFNTTGLSFGGWFRFNQTEIANVINAASYTSTATTPTGNILGNTSYGGIGLIWTGNNHYSSGTFSSMNVFAALRTSSVNNSTSGFVVTFNTWIHIMLTWDPNTHILSLYKNGTLISTKTFNNFTDGVSRTLYLNYKAIYGGNGPSLNIPIDMNDIRIYDHCLSAAEVREISQGLVLHYKLDDKYVETSTFITSTISTTAYNSQNGKYGYNADSNLTKTEGFFQGKNCIKVSTITAGQNAQPYSYFSNLFTSNGTNSPAYKALSFDYFTTCPTTTWLNIYKLGSGTGTATWKTTSPTGGTHSGVYDNSSNSILVQPNEWNHVEVILHGTTDADAQWGYCINGPKHTSSPDYYFLFANIQVELNSHVTGYGQGLHDSIIRDSSGYNHHAISNGSQPVTIDSDTPKYSYSMKFVAGSRLAMPVASSTCLPTDAITVSIWYKSSTGTNRFLSCTERGGWNFEVNSSKCSFPFYIKGKGYGRVTATKNFFSDNQWHMLTASYDGINTAKIYLDGVLDNTSTIASGWENLPIAYNSSAPLTLGAEAQSIASPIAGTYVGNLSDLRIYCTAIGDDAVRQLYQMGAKIDNKGNAHAFELIETQSNIHYPIELNRTLLQWGNGLGRFQQANNTSTLTPEGLHIYRPPNLTTANDGNTMWGGMKLINQSTDTISPYNSTRDNIWNLQTGHTYLWRVHAKGQSTNSCSLGINHNMGNGVSNGVGPSPTILARSDIPANFQGEKDCFLLFTINDAIVKTCTKTSAGYTANSNYLSYRHFTFGWTYASTGALGTDVYLTNIRLYDVTSHMAEFTKRGQAQFYDFVEQMNTCKIIRNSELSASEFIEL